MFPMTHLYMAERFQDWLQVTAPADYNLGAVLPDVRYVVDLSWEQTHPAPETFWHLAQALPPEAGDADFAKGMLLHLVMDVYEPWYIATARQYFLPPLGRVVPRRVLKLLLEAAALELYPRANIPMTRRVPPVIARLGIPAAAVQRLRAAADPLLQQPSVTAAFEFVRTTSMAAIPAIRLLMSMAHLFLQTPLRALVIKPATTAMRQVTPLLERRVTERLARICAVVLPTEVSHVPIASLAPSA